MAKAKRSKRSNMRIFFLTSLSCFLVFFMCAGFVIADYNTRKIGFDDASLRIDVFAENDHIDVNILGREQSYALPKTISEWTGRVWNLLPPGVRTAIWLFEGESEAASRVIGNAQG